VIAPNDSTDPAHLHERAIRGDAQAQFLLGREYAGRQAMGRARRLFQDAARQGHAGALTELGLLHLFGIGTDPDLVAATEYLLAGEQAGSAEAAYQLGVMAWCDGTVAFDLARMQERLRFAAQGGHAPALRAIALVYARDPAHAALAETCLRRAAALGDAPSGDLLARRGAPAPTSAVAPPLPELPTPKLDIAPPAVHEVKSRSPFIETIDDVLSAEECALIITLGAAYLQPSIVLTDSAQAVRSVYRTSSEMTFSAFREDFALRWIQWRMIAATGATLAQAEHTILLRYLPGQENGPHHDYLLPSFDGNEPHPDMPGQRASTVFCYLNDVDEGGETDFPLAGVRVAPRRGRTVHFRNLTDDGAPNAQTLHAGLPVVRGEKWLATIWTRERRYRYC
jgi:hypothetical protein